jgi:micrococcal nuclease
MAIVATTMVAGCDETDLHVSTARDGSSTATVASVTDGDTLRLRDGRRVRLLQIDAPEQESECYGRAATRALRRLTPPGSVIGLRSDPGLDDRDQHGRLLRYVVRGGTAVNLELVRRGAAVPYFFRGERGVHAGVLVSAARRARREHLGLWGACPGAQLDPDRGAVTGSR